MRKLVYLLAIIAFASCNQPSGFVINGTIEGAEGTVVLEKQTNRTWATLDSAQIVDGKFTFSGEVAFPETYYLSFGKRKKAMLFLENSEISVVGKVDSLRGVVVTGSKTHDEYNAFNSKLEEVSKSMMSKYREARKLQGEEKTEEAEKLMAEVDELYRQTMDMQRQFIRENPASFVAPFFLSKIFYDMDADTLEAYLNGFDEKLAVSPIIENFRERVTNLRKVAIGQKAPDFEMLDPDAKIVKVTSIYPANKYTLIDFGLPGVALAVRKIQMLLPFITIIKQKDLVFMVYLLIVKKRRG